LIYLIFLPDFPNFSMVGLPLSAVISARRELDGRRKRLGGA
jgi:hypothetical protein